MKSSLPSHRIISLKEIEDFIKLDSPLSLQEKFISFFVKDKIKESFQYNLILVPFNVYTEIVYRSKKSTFSINEDDLICSSLYRFARMEYTSCYEDTYFLKNLRPNKAFIYRDQFCMKFNWEYVTDAFIKFYLNCLSTDLKVFKNPPSDYYLERVPILIARSHDLFYVNHLDKRPLSMTDDRLRILSNVQIVNLIPLQMIQWFQAMQNPEIHNVKKTLKDILNQQACIDHRSYEISLTGTSFKFAYYRIPRETLAYSIFAKISKDKITKNSIFLYYQALSFFDSVFLGFLELCKSFNLPLRQEFIDLWKSSQVQEKNLILEKLKSHGFSYTSEDDLFYQFWIGFNEKNRCIFAQLFPQEFMHLIFIQKELKKNKINPLDYQDERQAIIFEQIFHRMPLDSQSFYQKNYFFTLNPQRFRRWALKVAQNWSQTSDKNLDSQQILISNQFLN